MRTKNLAPDQILIEIRSASGLREEMLMVVETGTSPKILTFGFRLLEATKRP